MTADPAHPRLPIVALISGRGSNLKAIIDARDQGLPVDIRCVISNRPGAPGLDHARQAGIATKVLDHEDFPDRATFDDALHRTIETHAPGLVVLAGFMRMFTDAFARAYECRMVNIHPSLLPAFRGLHTHERALEAGVSVHGASVHFVTPELDAGPVVLQARVPVLPGDTADTLAARVLEQEHRIYPMAIRWYAEGRLRCHRGQAWLDDRPMTAPVVIEPDSQEPGL